MSEPTAAETLEEAIELTMLLHEDPDDPEISEAVRLFRARGPAFEAAWQRVSSVAGASTSVLGTQQKRRLNRRRLLAGGLVLVGGSALAVSQWPGSGSADLSTGRGELREFRLADNTLAVLAPQSALALDLDGDRRSVRLLDGQGYFEVAPDPRPFELSHGDLLLTARDAAFELGAAELSLSVKTGSVAATIGADALLVGSDEWARHDGTTWQHGHRPFTESSTWRERLLVAEDQTLASLVERIGRWMPEPVLMLDPAAGNARVSGVFDLSDPRQALEAAVSPAGAKLRQVGGLVTLVSPI